MKRTILLTMFTAGLSIASAQITIPDGTKIRVRLNQTISSATSEEGQTVELEVADTVKVADTIAIPAGARVTGTVTEAHEKRRMGRAGKLDFSIDRVRTNDGEWIPLRYTLQKKSGQSHAVRTGIVTAGVAAFLWPAAPLALLMKGKDITINKGVTFDVFTESDRALAATPATTARNNNLPAAVGSASVAATVSINSSIDGADIEIDGAFIGSTPTTIQIQAGSHQFVVRNDAQTWSRTLNINPGSTVSLRAVLGTDSASARGGH